jgi:hypothetical protein
MYLNIVKEQNILQEVNMNKIFEMLGIEKLDEAKQDKLKETLQTVIDTKAVEIAEGKVESILSGKKEELVEEYEDKFNSYKEEITEKFSNFVDDIVEKEMVIPENVIKYAHLGELYEGLIEQFKVRLAIDEGMIDGETKSMLKEAKDEIEALRSKLDEAKGKELNLESDTSKMAAHIYLRQKCDGLVEAQKKYVLDILGDETIKESIDKKFDTVIESMKLKLSVKEADDKEEKDGDVTEMTCPECGATATIKEGDDNECPECGTKMDKTEVKEGHASPKKTEDLNEKKDAFSQLSQLWLGTMKDNRV